MQLLVCPYRKTTTTILLFIGITLQLHLFSSKPPSFGTTPGRDLYYTHQPLPTQLLLWHLPSTIFLPSFHLPYLLPPNPPQCSTTPDPLQREQTAAEQEPQPDADQCPEEAQGGWDNDESSTQSYTQPIWDDAETAQAQESWTDDGVYAAQSYTEPNWDDDGAPVGQGGWDDDGEAQVGSGGQGGRCDLSGVWKRSEVKAWNLRIPQIPVNVTKTPLLFSFSFKLFKL